MGEVGWGVGWGGWRVEVGVEGGGGLKEEQVALFRPLRPNSTHLFCTSLPVIGFIGRKKYFKKNSL